MSDKKSGFLACGASMPLWAAIFAATAAFPAAAYAQAASASADAAANAASEEAQRVAPDDIVVSARKRSERLLDVPVAATGVSQLEIRQYNIVSVADIKLAAPQVSFDRGFTGGGASIALRGVSTQSLDGGL